MKLSVFNVAVFLAVVVCVHCNRIRSGDGWTDLKKGACIKLNKYLMWTGRSLEVCKQKCEDDTCCKSISYNASKKKCLFSTLGSRSNFYQDDCWFEGYEYTEKLTEISFDYSWSKLKNACIRENYYKHLEDHSVETCRAMCEVDRDTGVESCKSISYEAATRTCHFSTCSHLGFRYTEPCHLPGYEYTELQLTCGMCPDGFLPLGSQCLMYVKERKTWEDARSFCQEKSAELAQPNDIEALRTFINDDPPNYTVAWVGARRKGRVFEWLNGARAPVKDSNNDGDCVFFNSVLYGGTGGYLGWTCTNTYWFICQAV